MKFDATEPQEGQFNFRAGDTLVEFAQKYGMKVHGHTFLWHSQTPNWVFQNPNDGRPMREVVLARLENHIRALMTHWKGKIQSWDVCNECFEDDGRPRGFSPWRQNIGDDYMEQAFRIADKVAKELGEEKVLLVYNDFNMYKPGMLLCVWFLLRILRREHYIPVPSHCGEHCREARLQRVALPRCHPR